MKWTRFPEFSDKSSFLLQFAAAVATSLVLIDVFLSFSFPAVQPVYQTVINILNLSTAERIAAVSTISQVTLGISLALVTLHLYMVTRRERVQNVLENILRLNVGDNTPEDINMLYGRTNKFELKNNIKVIEDMDQFDSSVFKDMDEINIFFDKDSHILLVETNNSKYIFRTDEIQRNEIDKDKLF